MTRGKAIGSSQSAGAPEESAPQADRDHGDHVVDGP